MVIETTDSEVIQVIRKFIKNNNEAFRLSNNPKFMVENEILEAYLPVQLTQVELEDIIKQFLDSSTDKSIGACIRYMKDNYEGRYDYSLVLPIIKWYTNV